MSYVPWHQKKEAMVLVHPKSSTPVEMVHVYLKYIDVTFFISALMRQMRKTVNLPAVHPMVKRVIVPITALTTVFYPCALVMSHISSVSWEDASIQHWSAIQDMNVLIGLMKSTALIYGKKNHTNH